MVAVEFNDARDSTATARWLQHVLGTQRAWRAWGRRPSAPVALASIDEPRRREGLTVAASRLVGVGLMQDEDTPAPPGQRAPILPSLR